MSPSTASLRSTLTLFRQIHGAKTAARAAAFNRFHHKNQMISSSGKCQRALETKNQKLKTQNSKLKTQNQQNIPLPKEKNTATFGDIWGHLGTYVPLLLQNERAAAPQNKGLKRPRCQIRTRRKWGRQPGEPGWTRRVARIETFAPKGEVAKESLNFSPSRLPPNWMVRPSATAPWSSKRLPKRAPEPLSHAICRSPRGCYRVHALLSTA